MPEIDIPFRVVSAEPVKIRLETRGKKYELRFVPTVLQVLDTGETLPDGLPAIAVKSQMMVLVTEVPDAND